MKTLHWRGLESGQLSSVALDVFEVEPAIDNPLFKHENFHGTPHIGAATKEAQERIGTEMAGLIIEHLEGEKTFDGSELSYPMHPIERSS